ncbi:hypothetical protein AUJ68_01035 [Candidatus Woesearchaeota archaeon CG1_02_57_44]|nr:MAG: hypothetical protein AUJ68_01035 [Candidatus Woesearchaeota archaeon CG1_02_57_44]PIN67477.1 MAG: hypothetical protein COV94_07280 [Candidatus Woesearchaeota archaeon CG11_big_fil_rev_8_21_14_0_20_57_5]
MYGSERRSFAPVSEGEELDVTIEAVGEKGDGIAKVKGFVLFVPNTKQGQVVKVRITKVLRKVGFAEVIGQGSGAAAPSNAPSVQPEPEQEYEDTEDFGEESSDDASDDAADESSDETADESSDDSSDDVEEKEE